MAKYMSGFGNHFSSESIKGSLPVGMNSPQKPKFGLYAEQFSLSAFTMPRNHNLHTWMYRINPSVKHSKFIPLVKPRYLVSSPFNTICPPNQMRWNKLDASTDKLDFITSLTTMAGNGNTAKCDGGAIHIYNANISMTSYFYNADGEFLIVPQEGRLLIRTELGEMEIEPLEIAIIPRGMKFQVCLLDKIAYGYVCENYGSPFQLPELGVIGSNCLANRRDFLIPVAKYENITGEFELICKFEGSFWQAKIKYSPFDVVAWHGNATPYKYDLRKFNTLGSISFDHPDPSIFTVLTSPTSTPGLANIDFVIFPPRWMVAENTFRAPWYHRNIMSEFMGLIMGEYDAKPEGFVPGGSSLHNRMVAHGPDSEACIKAMNKELKPLFLADTMAFMFESSMPWQVTEFALTTDKLQDNYIDCWQSIPVLFENDNV